MSLPSVFQKTSLKIKSPNSPWVIKKSAVCSFLRQNPNPNMSMMPEFAKATRETRTIILRKPHSTNLNPVGRECTIIYKTGQNECTAWFEWWKMNASSFVYICFYLHSCINFVHTFLFTKYLIDCWSASQNILPT